MGRALLFSGPILYLIPQGWYLWYVARKIPYDRFWGVLVLALTLFFTLKINNLGTLLIMTIELIILSYLIICHVQKENS